MTAVGMGASKMRWESRTRPSGQVWCRDCRPVKPADCSDWSIPASAFTAAVQRVLVLRHGESTWNVEAPLAGLARRAAHRRRARPRPRPGPGSSPTTASCPAPSTPPTSDGPRAPPRSSRAHLECPVVPDAGFRERNGGEWQGRTGDEIDERWPGMRDAWRRGELDRAARRRGRRRSARALRRRARARARARRRGARSSS